MAQKGCNVAPYTWKLDNANALYAGVKKFNLEIFNNKDNAGSKNWLYNTANTGTSANIAPYFCDKLTECRWSNTGSDEKVFYSMNLAYAKDDAATAPDVLYDSYAAAVKAYGDGKTFKCSLKGLKKDVLTADASTCVLIDYGSNKFAWKDITNPIMTDATGLLAGVKCAAGSMCVYDKDAVQAPTTTSRKGYYKADTYFSLDK